MKIFYTYAWLREDRTPYYIGKGKGKRAWRKESPPVDRVLILKDNLTEEEAFKHEIYMIAIYGRKDLGTGILINFTEGGQGTSGLPRPDLAERNRLFKGLQRSEEFSLVMREVTQGEKNPMYGRKRPDLSERNRQRKGVPLRPETKLKMVSSHTGKKWISNQTEEKCVDASVPIPEGWEEGRIKGKPRKKRIHEG
jgi:hypothetical protein